MNRSNECKFVFSDEPLLGEDEHFVLSVTEGLSNENSLFEFYAQAANFPDYFGHNWDAFDECLRDLSWIRNSRMTIRHKDLPLRNDDKLLQYYLSILSDAIESSRRYRAPSLYVVFPTAYEDQVRAAISRGR